MYIKYCRCLLLLLILVYHVISKQSLDNNIILNSKNDFKQCDENYKTFLAYDCREEKTKQEDDKSTRTSPKTKSYLPTYSSVKNENFKTIATTHIVGRLGNHLWGYLILMFFEITYGIEIIVEKEVKRSLTTFFKNFEYLKTVDDVCGYNEFFQQYQDMIDNLTVRRYKEMSGINVTLIREGQTYTITPTEPVMKYSKWNTEDLVADSEEFKREFRVDYSKLPSKCPYRVSTPSILRE